MDQAAEQNLREILKARASETMEQAAQHLANERDNFEKELQELQDLLGASYRHPGELGNSVRRLIEDRNYQQQACERLREDRRFKMAKSALSGACMSDQWSNRELAVDAVSLADYVLEILDEVEPEVEMEEESEP
jgi:hypothetical protein